jgi:hypothetical protein
MAHFGEHYEMVYRRRRALKVGVLVHLRLYSPKQWDTLCSLLTIDQDAEVQAILRDLRHKHYIDVGTDKMVAITASGCRYLEEQFDQMGRLEQPHDRR